MYCKNCGSEINENETTCSNCNKVIKNENKNDVNGHSTTIQKETFKYYWKSILLVLVCSLLIWFVIFLIMSNGRDVGIGFGGSIVMSIMMAGGYWMIRNLSNKYMYICPYCYCYTTLDEMENSKTEYTCQYCNSTSKIIGNKLYETMAKGNDINNSQPKIENEVLDEIDTDIDYIDKEILSHKKIVESCDSIIVIMFVLCIFGIILSCFMR